MIRNRSQNRISSSGFTLLELIVVIAIIVVLVSLAAPSFSNMISGAQAVTCRANRREFLVSYSASTILGGETDHKKDVETALQGLNVSGGRVSGQGTVYNIAGLCPGGGTVTAKCSENGDITLTCGKHPDSTDTTGVAAQSGDFNAAAAAWIEENGNIKDKSGFYADYYESHPAVPMSDQYRAELVDAGLNKTIRDPLYWWTYTVTDGSGNLRYTVTYANTQSDPANWTNSSRGKMNTGYVVMVNGKTYIRTDSGHTVEPGNSTCPYQTEAALEDALIANGYKEMP